MKNKNLIIIGIILIIAIIIIIGIFVLRGQKPIETINNMTTNELVGKWNAISEETIDGINTNLTDYSIIFKNDYSYSETIAGVNTKGLYKIEGDKITLYQKGEDLTKPGRFNIGLYLINDNKLTLSLPIYPKTVVYVKG
jgi:hypothetical protein